VTVPDPLPPFSSLPGNKVTPSLLAMAALQVSDLDPMYMTMGDELALQIAYESLRALLNRHTATPRTGGPR
jgi:hypothetical protein